MPDTTETTHTPGPWNTDGTYIVGQVPDGRPGGEVIARAKPTVTSLETPDLANARLIAAAPDYHEAAEFPEDPGFDAGRFIRHCAKQYLPDDDKNQEYLDMIGKRLHEAHTKATQDHD